MQLRKAGVEFSPARFSQYAKDLSAAIDDLRREQGKRMSITGAKFLGNQFREQLAAVKDMLSKASDDMGNSMKELQDVAGQATQIVKSVQDETAELKAALGLVTNSPPEVANEQASNVATIPPRVDLSLRRDRP